MATWMSVLMLFMVRVCTPVEVAGCDSKRLLASTMDRIFVPAWMPVPLTFWPTFRAAVGIEVTSALLDVSVPVVLELFIKIRLMSRAVLS